MADLDTLKSKYAPVTEAIQSFGDLGATLDSEELDGEKLQLKATVPSKVVANRIWDIIKSVDESYADLDHQMTTSGGDEQPYTIKSGDNLSKISERFYGHANKYNEIAQANNIENPDLIKVGEEIKIPVLS
jgi:nucleoid-associated protein YgaU